MATDFSGRSGHQLVADFKSAVGRLGPLVAGEKDSLIGVSSQGNQAVVHRTTSDPETRKVVEYLKLALGRRWARTCLLAL